MKNTEIEYQLSTDYERGYKTVLKNGVPELIISSNFLKEILSKMISLNFIQRKLSTALDMNYEESDFWGLHAPWNFVDFGHPLSPIKTLGKGLNAEAMTIDYDKMPNIRGFEPWLYLVNDFTGLSVVVYYPKKNNTKKGDTVDVIVVGAYVQYKIKWVHGEIGLFKNQIIPLLNAESDRCCMVNVELIK